MPEGPQTHENACQPRQGGDARKCAEGLTPAELFKVWAATGMPITLPPETVKAVAAYVEGADHNVDQASHLLKRVREHNGRMWMLLFFSAGFCIFAWVALIARALS